MCLNRRSCRVRSNWFNWRGYWIWRKLNPFTSRVCWASTHWSYPSSWSKLKTGFACPYSILRLFRPLPSSLVGPALFPFVCFFVSVFLIFFPWRGRSKLYDHLTQFCRPWRTWEWFGGSGSSTCWRWAHSIVLSYQSRYHTWSRKNSWTSPQPVCILSCSKLQVYSFPNQ